jgi:hypothetical protein
MLENELNQRQRGISMTSRTMPCLILRSESNFSSYSTESRPSSLVEELTQLRARKEGFLRGGFLLPLGWRELLEVEENRPVMDTDEWEDDDDIVDDDDDDDEDEEEEDEDFFPDDDDEFEEDDDEDDEDEDEGEEDE